MTVPDNHQNDNVTDNYFYSDMIHNKYIFETLQHKFNGV